MALPPGLAFHQAFPGATTCILIGELAAAPPPDLGSYGAVLWITDRADRDPPRLAPTAALRRLPFSTSPADLARALTDFLRLNPRRLPTLMVTAAAVAPSVHAARATVIEQVHAELESQHRARVTRQQDGFAWQSHLLANLPSYVAHPVPAAWRDALAGMPAFVCGAGPSLDVSAPRLSAAASDGIVFAADSALRALARHQVTADFAVSIDVAKQPEKCLPPPGQPAPARVVLSAVSPPAWTSALPRDAQAFVASRQITTDWLASLGVPAPAVAAAENCGVTALELARFLGCRPIYLFGLDLALSATQRHTNDADASIYLKSGFDAGQRYPEIPGNYAATVPTHAIGDWRALEERLAEWPADLVYNVNDRGARLRNTVLIPPADFESRFSPPPARSKQSALGTLQPPAVDAAAVGPAFERVSRVARRAQASLPLLREALRQSGPAGLAAALRPLFADPEAGRMLGGFSLKVMPHLVAPIEGDARAWSTVLDELDELLARATQATADCGTC